MIEFVNAGLSLGPRTILRDVSLTLEAGSFHVVVGASGSGKTMFVELCHGARGPSRGTIRHFGRRAVLRRGRAVSDLRRMIGVASPDAPFLDHLTLAQNVALPLRVSGVDPATRAGDIGALLDWVGLGGRREVLPPELTEAERMRGALARAVVLSPQMVVADAPTDRLDAGRETHVLRLLAELHRMEVTLLVTTRDPRVAEVLGDQTRVQVFDLRDGQLRPAGRTA